MNNSDEIIAAVQANPSIKLLDLLQEFNVDDVYTLIARNNIFIDLWGVPIAEPERVCVFADSEIAKAFEITTVVESGGLVNDAIKLEVGSQFSWNNDVLKLVNVSEDQITAVNESEKLIELKKEYILALAKKGAVKGINCLNDDTNSGAVNKILGAGPENLANANKRYSHIVGTGDESVPERTRRDWAKKFANAQISCGNGYVGLIPKDKQKGNRSSKLPPIVYHLMEESIDKSYESPVQKSIKQVYGELLNICEQEGVIPPSYKTFCKEVHRRPRIQQATKKGGKKVGYGEDVAVISELNNQLPRHGDRPYEVVHIDHAFLDIELVDSRTGKNLGRPWLTVMVDSFSRRILAFYLSFDPPSVKSIMMVFRECVKRHARLPQTVVVDNGKEFHSVYFDAFLARYEITIKYRPPAEPRSGAICERIFGTLNTQFIHNLIGNTKIMKKVRVVTKSVNPRNLASWSLETLHNALYAWAYEIYDTISHPSLGQSPAEAFASGMAISGSRPFRVVPYTREFEIYTLPPTDRGTAKVQPSRGIKCNNIYYWNEGLLNPEVEKTIVPVRYDPFNIGHIYAYVRNQWIECQSEHFHVLSGKSEKMIELATDEIKKNNTNHSRKFTVTAKILAKFITDAENENVLETQRLRDSANRSVREKSLGEETISATDSETILFEQEDLNYLDDNYEIYMEDD